MWGGLKGRVAILHTASSGAMPMARDATSMDDAAAAADVGDGSPAGQSSDSTPTLLVVDAWFDIMTSADRRSLLIAVCFALFLELPGAGLSLYLASRVNDEVDRLAEAQLDKKEGLPST